MPDSTHTYRTEVTDCDSTFEAVVLDARNRVIGHGYHENNAACAQAIAFEDAAKHIREPKEMPGYVEANTAIEGLSNEHRATLRQLAAQSN